MSHQYVHGYTARESQRLREQSEILEQILHQDTVFPSGSHVLEAGCGVGAQSQILSKKNPDVKFTAIDISNDSIVQARARNLPNYKFQPASVFNLPFADDAFDHVFVCFVLEHLDNPGKALLELKRVLKPNGRLMVIEADHGSCFWHPETEASRVVWHALIRVQLQLNHDPNIGRRLHPLITEAGFTVESTRPCWLYADANYPDLLDGMVNKIIVPMVKTARESALDQGMVDPETWNRGIRELEASGDLPNGTFFYTWFKSIAVK